MKICFETNLELPQLREDLDFAAMCLKLKGDPDTRHTTGLMKAFTALGRCGLILDTLRLQPNSAHYIEQFQDLQMEAQEYVTRYRTEFKLTIVQDAAHQPPRVVTPPVTRPEMPRPASNGNGTQPSSEPANKVAPPDKAKIVRSRLDYNRVAQIKRTLASFGPTINWGTIEKASAIHPDVAPSSIYQIATDHSHKDVPWPDNRKPVYQRSED